MHIIHFHSHPHLASKLDRLSSNKALFHKKVQSDFHCINSANPHEEKSAKWQEWQFSEISSGVMQYECSIKSSIQILSPPLQIDWSIKGLCDVDLLVTRFVKKTWTNEWKWERERKEGPIWLQVIVYQIKYQLPELT